MGYAGESLRRAVLRLAEELRCVSGDEAYYEASLMLEEVTGRDRLELLTDITSPLGLEQADRLEDMLKRRLEHEPLQYILGSWELMGLSLYVGEGVLIPRQDTETVIETALGIAAEKGCRTALDLCCGSGCIGTALAKLGGLCVTMADISPACLETAAKNAERNGISARVLHSDLFDGIEGKFDLIVCNPPYIPTGVLPTLSDEVKREPMLALDGGADGLDFYRRIAAEYQKYLNKNGALVLEIGFDQGESVPMLFRGKRVKVIKDLNLKDRCVTVQ